jgi:phospholipase D-like protein
MQGDIISLLNFQPPQYLCAGCLCLLEDFEGLEFLESPKGIRCEICGTKYLPTEAYDTYQIREYLDFKGLGLRFRDPIRHSQGLARVATSLREGRGQDLLPYPPLRALFEALQEAECFVHFVTFGISHILLGALKAAAVHVPVRGIVSGVDEAVLDELTKFRHEAPRLEIHVFERKARPEDWDKVPHQKVVVVDGLLAFKGSANLRESAWRKATEGRELVEVVTDIGEVAELHNQYFSPVWAGFKPNKEIVMSSDIPF